MSTPQQPVFVDSEVLRALVEDKSKIPGKDYLVIDVRDDDHVGGHIPGSVNYPSMELPDRLPELVQKHKDVPELYFHCALSQVRGPKAARRWSEALYQAQARAQQGGPTQVEVAVAAGSAKQQKVQKVHILQGGFGAWQQKYKNQQNLVEGYQASYWEEDY